MSEPWGDLLQKLPVYLGGHMTLSASALAVGLLVSLPLGIVASRRPRLVEWTVGIAGVVQTVPSLALLALMVALLNKIGFTPAFLALTLYSILPILANTVIGIRGVDPALIEAARGLGMNSRQMLWRVELPLAAPVIIGGVRTATVLVVGTATLVTPVGGRSLGNYIFGGMETLNHVSTIFGCVLAALLAVVIDQLIHLLELAARRRSRALAWTGAAGLLLIVIGSLYYPASRLLDWRANPARIAGGPFTEQHILNEVLALRMEGAHFRPDQRMGMCEGLQFEALFQGELDCIVNYSGNIWTLVMKEPGPANPNDAVRKIADYLRQRHGVLCLGSLGFEDKYVFAMPEERADELGICTIDELARYVRDRARSGKPPLRIGGDYQFFERPEWQQVKQLYGIEDQSVETKAMDPTLMYGAIQKGQVDVISAYSSDGRIAELRLKILEDSKGAFPPYDALLLISSRGVQKEGLVDALRPLVDAIRLEDMQQANYRVDVQKWPPRRAAEELLATAVQRK